MNSLIPFYKILISFEGDVDISEIENQFINRMKLKKYQIVSSGKEITLKIYCKDVINTNQMDILDDIFLENREKIKFKEII